MVRFEIQVRIGRPVDDTYRYVTDVSKLADWQSTLAAARLASDGPVAVGAQVVETRKFLAQRWERIVRGLTAAMVAIEGENMRPVTWVVLAEVRSGDWGIAGTR